MIQLDTKNPNNMIIAIPNNISTELKIGRSENISFISLRLMNAHTIIVITAIIGITRFNTSIEVPPLITLSYRELFSLHFHDYRCIVTGH